ncbi:RsuA/RluB/C/D/E/F family pseudouridylate synthase protein [Rhizobium phaseoli]|uniref:Pseudouridine synthase n=1 Tax=Rhizobium phaseoli TaxID=396 RepID=A0A192T7Z3_9HYPH|nr:MULTISPECIES: pseudouridine synthase [Rhizobium]MDH6649992.1 23S rRNA pseudouridine2605 synthase [Rhizobium esperanzae]ANL39332.1 RsuA/RluB/C/D/E/F family pseudouridylate synthase protein [Rhizobium phaseoli]ANL52065.1 RsuA/RluB/C/D/E/F family pseudouridylate synthase protein [Rhizobium phaseoli]ANL58321.1 RsuA/RluB/C/D/E/F family pseudouridylate synthase protein [Rhizobium phaseoli]ANL64555.1 RsuA/RluB/C/D/E/F family pseudouridylate synthase protein [Rhizobium phaseoli]
MTSKDKPKRPGAKPFSRDAGAKAGPKAGAAKPAKAAAARPAAAETESEAKAERISKVMARAGVASRRDIERMIMEGRVTLNGKVLETPVVNVTLADRIEVDGMPIRGIERTRLWLYHKPAGLVTTNADPEGRPTVFDNLPEELPRVMSIGRLDINTEGLLLLTNDGGLARALELPATGWLRRYRVRAHGEIDQEALDKLKDGIAVDGVLYGSIEATLDRTQGSNVWITMGLREGKNREIKNVLGALGLDVNRLIRISYGPFQLGDLPEGHVIEVRGRTLRDQLGPRLIEEAKANFDAPIYNAPAVAAEEEAEVAAPEKRERPRRDEDKRERALSRLDTKRDDRRGDDRRGGARRDDDRRDGGRRDDEKPKRSEPLGQRRSANVWMAPGARPLGEKAAAKAAKNAQTARRRGEQAPAKSAAFDRIEDRPRTPINRVREEDGEWIRSSEQPRRKDEGEGFGRKRSFGDRPAREDRGFGERPSRGDRPFGDKPRGDRRPRADGDERPRATRAAAGEGRSERPRGDRPFGDRPSRGDRPFGDKPRGDRRPREDGDERPRAARSFAGEGRSERPRGERSFGDKAPGGKPSGDKPRGKGFGARPGGSKNFSGKPKGGKPGSDRPGGDRPAGGPSRGGGKGKGMTRGADRRR